MNKKVIYAALAVLLVLVIAIALFIFGGNESKNDTASNLTSFIDNSTTESTESKFEELEEAPILSNKNDIPEKKPEKNTGSKYETSTKNESIVNSQESSKPSESKPTDTSKSEEDPSEVEVVKYEDFLKMTSAEQQKYVNSFSNMEAFFDWYNAAKKNYEKENPPIEVGKDDIDIGDIIADKE